MLMLTLSSLLDRPKSSLVLFLLLRMLNPFTIWYWTVVCRGMYQTGQLPRRTAIWATIVIGLILCFGKLILLDAVDAIHLDPAMFGGSQDS